MPNLLDAAFNKETVFNGSGRDCFEVEALTLVTFANDCCDVALRRKD